MAQFQSGPQKIHQGDYLALEVTNGGCSDLEVNTSGCSSVKSPCSNPGYPAPEIASGVLFRVGLPGSVGYVGLRRYKILA
jgi:hypothetical protein